ncbi:nitrate/nitrite sensor protein [Klebsiella michiganensis]|uniref:Nitrate/nitrite sensor protein n=1 Tax=Klebsiella michiganensis TaxID=1134687 RepID=A0A7H4PKX3_9ENTR|nr:nitrate/nitrite sensor protein [Klebsiella michiganensis]
MATLGMALNNMSEELAESYSVLERRVQEKTGRSGAEKTRSSPSCGRPTADCTRTRRFCERISPVLNGLQGLTLLRDIEVRVYDYGR